MNLSSNIITLFDKAICELQQHSSDFEKKRVKLSTKKIRLIYRFIYRVGNFEHSNVHKIQSELDHVKKFIIGFKNYCAQR